MLPIRHSQAGAGVAPPNPNAAGGDVGALAGAEVSEKPGAAVEAGGAAPKLKAPAAGADGGVGAGAEAGGAPPKLKLTGADVAGAADTAAAEGAPKARGVGVAEAAGADVAGAPPKAKDGAGAGVDAAAPNAPKAGAAAAERKGDRFLNINVTVSSRGRRECSLACVRPRVRSVQCDANLIVQVTTLSGLPSTHATEAWSTDDVKHHRSSHLALTTQVLTREACRTLESMGRRRQGPPRSQ